MSVWWGILNRTDCLTAGSGLSRSVVGCLMRMITVSVHIRDSLTVVPGMVINYLVISFAFPFTLATW